jgi:hypothetical protein
LKKSADHFQRIGLIGNADKAACAESVQAAARLVRRAGRKIFCDAATAQITKLKGEVFPDAAALARATDLFSFLAATAPCSAPPGRLPVPTRQCSVSTLAASAS